MATPPPEGGLAALDLRIAQAEQRLLARQQGIRARWGQLRQGTQQALRPQRLLMPLLGTGLAGIVAWWLRRALAPSPAVGPAVRPRAETAARGGLSWSELLLVAWPLLPAAWRSRVSPATATSLLALGLPLWHQLRGAQAHTPPPATAANVDLARYAGTWFEIARLAPALASPCAGPRSITYTLRGGEDGGFELLRRAPARRRAGEQLTRGVAQVVPGSGGARFKLSLLPAWLRWLPLAWVDDWVLHVDADYTVALVGDPDRQFLRLLARTPQMAAEDLQALVAVAHEQGYEVDRLQVVRQGGQDAPDAPRSAP